MHYQTLPPHIHRKLSTPAAMFLVSLVVAANACLAFVHATPDLALHILTVLCLSVLTCLITEAVIEAFKKQFTLSDGSALVTGLLLASIIPPGAPPLLVILSSVFAIAVAKELFGGLGSNWLNPALAGRLFLTLTGFAQHDFLPVSHAPAEKSYTTGATVLKLVQSYVNSGGARHPDAVSSLGWHPFLFGLPVNNPIQAIGTHFPSIIILGALVLVAFGVIRLLMPLVFCSSYLLLSFFLLFPVLGSASLAFGTALVQLLFGSVLFGALFMVTDPTTSPHRQRWQIVYATLGGCLTALFNQYSSFASNAMLGIAAANMFVPMMNYSDRITQFFHRNSTGSPL